MSRNIKDYDLDDIINLIKELIDEELEKVAAKIDKHKCEACGGQDPHDYCEPPDVANAIRNRNS